MNELNIIKRDGGAYIDSREVADAIGKRHDHLLRDIGNYIDIIEKVTDPNFGVSDFFVESIYKDRTGRSLLCYLISKMGCELVANKLIGEKGILFTVAYVSKFNEMEAAEREAEIKAHARPRLGEFNSAVRNVLRGMAYCFAKPGKVMSFLRGVYEPLGVEVLPFSEEDCCRNFTVTEIAEIYGLCSSTGKPHGHAVSAIISKIENAAKHAIIVPYGLVGVVTRYDYHIVNAVRDWLAKNGYPHEIPYLDFYYHIYYDRQMSLFDYDDDEVIDLNDKEH